MPTAGPLDGESVASLLQRLQLVLVAHLKLEDHSLYPVLEQSSNVVLSRKANRYKTHMGSLAETFAEFYAKWGTPRAISSEPTEFLDEWLPFQAALRLRMDSEDEDLYEMAEQVFTSDRDAETKT